MTQLQRLEQYIQMGDVEQIRSVLEELKLSTQLNDIYDAAHYLASYGFLTEANELYEILLLHLPDEAQLKIDQANLLIELGEEDEALLRLKEISKEDEEYAQSLLVQADYYHMIGHAETAIHKVKEAHELHPDEPIIQFAYAELLLDAGKYAEAIRLYLQIKAHHSKIGDISLSERLAETYRLSGAYEQSIPYYEELLSEHPSLELTYQAAFAYFQTGNGTRTIQLLEEIIGADKDFYAAYMLLGQAHLSLEENQKAYQSFLAGIKRDEFNHELYVAAGKCALKLGWQAEAEEHLAEALALEPENIEALVTLASLYHELEKDEALLALIKDHEQVEDLAILQAFIASAYERMELYKDAYDAFKKAYDGMKEDYDFLNAYASFLVEEGKRQEAIVVAHEIRQRFPEDQYWTAFLETENNREV